MTDRELMQQASEIEMLAKRFNEGWHEGIKIDALDIELLLDVAAVMRERLEQPIECMCGICKLGQRQWQGLTEQEIKDCEKQAMVNGALPFEQRSFFARAIEAKLKEKNT